MVCSPLVSSLLPCVDFEVEEYLLEPKLVLQYSGLIKLHDTEFIHLSLGADDEGVFPCFRPWGFVAEVLWRAPLWAARFRCLWCVALG